MVMDKIAARCGCGHLVEEHAGGTGGCLGVWRYPDVLDARECGCTAVRPTGAAPVNAPTVVAAVAAAEGHPITPAAPPLPLRTLTTEPGTPERDAELARWAADDTRAAERPCVAAASPAWPGPETCRQRWPEIPRGWCAGCKSAPDVEVGAGFIRVGRIVYPSGPLGEWPTSDAPTAPPAWGEAEDRRRIMELFPDRSTDGTLHHAILIAVAEIKRLRGDVVDDAVELLALTADYPVGHPLRLEAARLAAARTGGRAQAQSVTVPAEDLDHVPGRPVCDGCPAGEGHNR